MKRSYVESFTRVSFCGCHECSPFLSVPHKYVFLNSFVTCMSRLPCPCLLLFCMFKGWTSSGLQPSLSIGQLHKKMCLIGGCRWRKVWIAGTTVGWGKGDHPGFMDKFACGTFPNKSLVHILKVCHIFS